jgi:hypothetical protein
MRFYLLLLCTSLNSLQAAKEFFPLSYTMSLVFNNKTIFGTQRTLALKINDAEVGQVKYTIADKPSTEPSFVNLLHINQSYRNHKGYGKLLFYSALRDIVQSGGAPIELQRYPFDLAYGDEFVTRDEQLKKWYSAFGFKEKAPGSPYMRLQEPTPLTTIDVVPQFSEGDVSFALQQRKVKKRGQHLKTKNAGLSR